MENKNNELAENLLNELRNEFKEHFFYNTIEEDGTIALNETPYYWRIKEKILKTINSVS